MSKRFVGSQGSRVLEPSHAPCLSFSSSALNLPLFWDWKPLSFFHQQKIPFYFAQLSTAEATGSKDRCKLNIILKAVMER